VGQGLTLFAIGLAKKVIVADGLAGMTNAVFAEAIKGSAIAAADAWAGLLAFTFQLYFDFSGYSDMAIGLALLFGFQLPMNFNAPYKATSIREYWRRWHMTLMRFMRDYLYRPVGLALKGPLREPAAVMVTMVLVGLWHGAAWSYALFGAIHGVALVVNRLWSRSKLPMPRAAGWLLTFGFVVLCLSLFRSESVPASLNLLAGAFGFNGFASTLDAVTINGLALLAVAAAISFFGPTSQALVLERPRPEWPASLAVACTFVFIVLKARLGAPPDFVYFQF
jgi:D-alanyl-lipoteichoic acid acyltransferase DltB (MBOAT superfamily)